MVVDCCVVVLCTVLGVATSGFAGTVSLLVVVVSDVVERSVETLLGGGALAGAVALGGFCWQPVSPKTRTAQAIAGTYL